MIETIECFASARSAITNSVYIRVELTKIGIKNEHTEAIVQKKQDTGLSREEPGNASTEGSNAFVKSGIGNLHGTKKYMPQTCKYVRVTHLGRPKCPW